MKTNVNLVFLLCTTINIEIDITIVRTITAADTDITAAPIMIPKLLRDTCESTTVIVKKYAIFNIVVS